MKKQPIIICFLLMSLISCRKDEITISDNAKDFIDEVLGIMETASINRYKINWTDLRGEVFEKVGAAQTIEQTYVGIKEALVLLNDNHSFFRAQDGTYISGSTNWNCYAQGISQPSIPEKAGYVRVNWFSGSTNSDAAIAFAQEIQDQIRYVDTSSIQGWIVDLRGNSGGNMWPMLAGIGPILGEGIAGYFVDPDSIQISWGYDNGTSFYHGYPMTVMQDPYELVNPNPKVAVLLDKAVASSGEAIAIAFIGREAAKSFGFSTCGKSTANQGFNLSDNSMLFLTVAFMADRNMNLYGSQINPDVEVNNQDIIQYALEWLGIE